MILRLVNAISVVVILCSQHIAATSAITSTMICGVKSIERQDAQQEAQRLWEQAIAAKGGRERLYAVDNLVISSRGEYSTHRLKQNQVRSEALYVFPNKMWDWADYRPAVFGVTVHMYNYDTGMKYVITLGEPHHPPEPIEPNETRESRTSGLVSCLLETKWLKPLPMKASSGRVGLRPVNIVQTDVNGERIDFALDQKTHLPVRVSYYDVVRGKTYITAEDLSDYVEINGVKVPQTIKYDDGTEYKHSYQFNVEYNEEIFIKPPPIEAGPEAWKIAKR